VLAEATVLGIVGSTVGAAAGVLAGRAAIDSVPGVIVIAIGVRPSFTISPSALVLGVVVGTAATIVAALVPARSVSRVPPVDAMRPEGVLEDRQAAAVRPVPLVGGVVALIVGFVLVAVGGAPALVVPGFVLAVVGFISSTAGAMGPLASVVAKVAGVLGSAGRLGGAALERSPRRVWATTLAVAVGVSTVLMFSGSAENQLDTFSRSIASLGKPDLIVTTAPGDLFPAEGLMPDEWVARMSAVPGVRAVHAGQAFYATIHGRRVLLEGAEDPPTVPLVTALGPEARADVLAGRAVSVSRAFANMHGLETGDNFELPTTSGPRQVRVAGVADVLMPNPAGGIAMALGDLRRSYERAGANWLEIYQERGADRAEVRRQVTALTDTAGFPLWVYSGQELLEVSRRSLDQSGGVFRAMQWVVVGATALAVLNTLLISVLERTREVGILRAIGTSRRRVRRMVATEAVGIGVVGGAIGALFGLFGHWIAVLAFKELLGFKVRYEFLLLPVLVAGAAAAVIVVFASVAPALRAARVNVVEAIGYE
jgi:putative ABC transport system permease protein